MCFLELYGCAAGLPRWLYCRLAVAAALPARSYCGMGELWREGVCRGEARDDSVLQRQSMGGHAPWSNLRSLGSTGAVPKRTSLLWARRARFCTSMAKTGTQCPAKAVVSFLACGDHPSKDVFAVGAGGAILHYEGNAWTPMVGNTTSNMWSVWGSSSSNVFAVGTGGLILRYDGMKWSDMKNDSTADLYAIWGSSSGSIFTVGAVSTILHYSPMP